MSDDRMDRAERIRNMRQGTRGTDDEPATEDGDDTDSGSATTSADPEPTTTADTGQTASDPEPTTTADTGQTASDPEPTTTADTERAEPDPEPTTTSVDHKSPTTADDDASMAAQRAAASVAEVMGEDTATDPETPTGTTTESQQTATTTITGPSGVELPDQQLLEEAMAQSSVQTTEGGARAAINEESTQSEELVRVLEFSLGDEYYCLDIEYVEEIVKRDSVTRVPNTPDFVDGVVDLRGQITTILEPKEMMDIDAEGSQDLIVVFDPEQFEEQGAVGWVVDKVRQVVPVSESDVNDPPVDAEYINGVIDREEYDQFVIWIEPDDALAQASGTDDE